MLNGIIQPFQQEERVVGFFNTYRQVYPVSRDVLRDIAAQFHNWVKNRSQRWDVPILDAPVGRRDEFVDPYFKRAKTDAVVCIVKCREPARILTAIGKKPENRWHLELKQRWVDQYNFYLNDSDWGRMFVRLCPYFPFSARLRLNQHHWIAHHLCQQRIHFQQCSNAFIRCADATALQDIADPLTARDLTRCFSHVPAGDTFSRAEIHPDTAAALGRTTAEHTLGSLRYDLSKLRAKHLVEKLPNSRPYRLTAQGYRICLVYLKLFEKIYAPLTSGIMAPTKGDRLLPETRTTQLDKLYRAVVHALDQLVDAVGLKAA